MQEDKDISMNMRALSGMEETVAGRYYLIKYLAEGNFGAVYRASHKAYGLELRQVAIKISKRPMSDSLARRSFDDALIMAKTQDAAPVHLRERFVTVYDAGTCPDGKLAGRPYVVMEYVEGGSLKDSLKVGPFPLTRAVTYFDQILEAMACMHRQQLVHRDIKPSNILVSRFKGREDVLKVTDFGLAVKVDDLLGWIESGGDLAYLAPESFSHEICSPKTDVYMLGLTFYEMLTGENPFAQVGRHLRGDDPEKRRQLKEIHLNARYGERFERLERHEEIKGRPALGQVIRTALAPSMEGRAFNNAVELEIAWKKAKEGMNVRLSEQPLEKVRRLTDQAEHCSTAESAESLLLEAMEINRKMPDAHVAGKTYLLLVELRLEQGKLSEAGQLASEGSNRRKCRSTYRAMAAYCRKAGNEPLAQNFDVQADVCADKE